MSAPQRRIPALAAVLAALLLLGGCASAATDESGGDGFAPGAPEAPVDEGGGEGEPGVDPDPGDRDVITTGSLYLTVESPLEAADEAARIVERAGGRVDARTESAPSRDEYGGSGGDGGSAELVLRIPADELTSVLDDLEQLGEVEELSLATDDVTRTVQDLDARITALRSSIDRLLALQDAAATVEDLIALETAISDRQAQLESYEAEQRYYADQVSLSTLRLTLGSEAAAPVDEPDTFLSGLITGWEALVAFVGGALVVLGVLIPWLLVAGVVALVVWLIVRRAMRPRAGADAGDVAAPEPATSPVDPAP